MQQQIQTILNLLKKSQDDNGYQLRNWKMVYFIKIFINPSELFTIRYSTLIAFLNYLFL